jgi:outer membrane protein assembly factor BamB
MLALRCRSVQKSGLRAQLLLIAAVTPILGCNHHSISNVEGQLNPTKKWEFKTGNAPRIGLYYHAESSPAIAEDGTIYVGDLRGLLALNPDGTQRWLYEPPGPVTLSPVIDDHGTIWIFSVAQLNRVDPDGHGTPLFGIGRPSQVGVGFDGTVYMGTENGLVEFDPADNTNRIRFQGERFAFTSDGRIYTTDDVRPLALFLTNKDSNSPWISGGDFPRPTEPAIATDGTVYVTAASQLEAFADNGGGLWSFPADLPAPPCVASDGTIYFGSRDHRLYAVDPDGGLKWFFSTGGAIRSAPAISKAGFVYFGSEDGKLYSLDANGHKRWDFSIRGPLYSPTIAPDGTIYVQSVDGVLYAIQDPEPNGGLDGQWPKIGGGLKNMGRRLVQHGD